MFLPQTFLIILTLSLPSILSMPIGSSWEKNDVRPSAPVLSLYPRQVGTGVNGNQTNSSGVVSSDGDGLGDGNGVGFAGTGNDIDTGDDFDIGDGNTTMGDGNTIEIGDRINETTNINLGSGASLPGLNFTAPKVDSATGSSEMNLNINLKLTIEDGRITAAVV